MRTALLGLLGLALAVAVGFGVHLVTRDTISLPVVQLEQPPAAPLQPTTTERTTTVTTESATTTAELETETETDDSSGRGRGRGRSGGDSGGNSGSGGGDD
jgi:uncharacterized membrane protein YgcG